MLKIGISIDFDFFVREDDEWGFGHNEKDRTGIWTSRYLHVDLHRECDPKKYADFKPEDLLEKFKEKGILIPNDVPLGIADSHLRALKWFENDNLDLIINFDAHHDCWVIPMGGPDCGSWLTALPFDAICVYPKWKDISIDPDPAKKNVKLLHWENFEMNEPNIVTKIFLCRSGAWVPPHLDDLFGDLIHNLSINTLPRYLESLEIRPELNYSQIEKFRKEMEQWQKNPSTPIPNLQNEEIESQKPNPSSESV